jgi:2-phosphosulfolactate phosphatase
VSNDASPFTQDGFRCKLEWGWRGARVAGERGDIVVIVDVLRFSSTVATAVENGVIVYPCAWASDASALAAKHNARVAVRSSGAGGFSLSPRSFVDAPPDSRVVLPSLNGSQCSVNAASAPYVFAGALVNASAVASAVHGLLEATSLAVTVLACGERWREQNEDGDLRFAIEDMLGAGAILERLEAFPASPEAQMAAAAFARNRDRLADVLWECASGRELRDTGLEQDVRDCGRLDAVRAAPVLRNGAYQALDAGYG